MPATRSMGDQENLAAMLAFEKKAVIPLKWLMLAVSVWFFVILADRPWILPDVEPFMLFFLYGLFNVAQSYFFYANRIEPTQLRPFILTSYLVDLFFVTGLIWFDGRGAFGRDTHGDIYVFYFLIILRGVGLFRTGHGKILMNVVLSGLFILAIWQTFSQAGPDILKVRELALKLALIWMVMLVSWFIIDIITGQSEQLLRARESLLQSEHMAAVGEIAAGVAHEINNPIGIISANCEYLLRASPPDDPWREDFEMIRKEAERVKGIVAQLIDFSRSTQQKITVCDVRALNEEIVSFLFRDKRTSKIEVRVQYDEPLPRLVCDANQLKQALLNIYLNARQAVGTEGVVESRMGRSPDGRTLSISIADDGPGISNEAMERAFEPFYTSRPGGSGLGLAVTHRIITAHSGTIALQRLNPRGTLVRVELPLSTAARAA